VREGKSEKGELDASCELTERDELSGEVRTSENRFSPVLAGSHFALSSSLSVSSQLASSSPFSLLPSPSLEFGKSDL
jgi:hypothetical protein